MYPIKRKAAIERMVMVIRVRESLFGDASIGLEEAEGAEAVVEDEEEEEEGDMGASWTFIISNLKSTTSTRESTHQV